MNIFDREWYTRRSSAVLSGARRWEVQRCLYFVKEIAGQNFVVVIARLSTDVTAKRNGKVRPGFLSGLQFYFTPVDFNVASPLKTPWHTF